MWNLRLKFDFTQDDTAILAYIIALLLRSQDKKKKNRNIFDSFSFPS